VSLSVARYEARRRVRSTVVLTAGLSLFTLLVVGIFPSVAASGPALEEYVANLPEAVVEGFGVTAIGTVEGFLAAELYQFLWLLLLGLYLAYSAGGAVAGDVESGRMDLLLATPVSRSRVVFEKYLSLLVPILVPNLVVPLFVLGGVLAIGESVAVASLVAVHALSVPYLLVCAGVGLLLSVLVPRADVAQRGGIAAVFFLFVVDAVSAGTDYEWLGALSPTRYFDPVGILVETEYDLWGALLLLLVAAALLLASDLLFGRVDV
jgi:ABC-2 type transport system permease protein